jgi:hypothetical protein
MPAHMSRGRSASTTMKFPRPACNEPETAG